MNIRGIQFLKNEVKDVVVRSGLIRCEDGRLVMR